jgi:K+-sensing histidine kinase KdpD
LAIAVQPSTEPQRPASLVARTVLWFLLAALCTAGLALLRESLDTAHMALVYLLLVLFASAREGRVIGIAMSFLCFLAFNFFLLEPYYTLRLHNPLDWFVLVAFLVTGVVAAELLTRTKRLAAQTERIRFLRDADRLKDELLATLSHDLRTPLTTIKALATELRSDGDERAAVIEEEADRLNRLVGDLLDMSRVRAGVLNVNADLIAADDLLGAALQRLAGHPQAARIQARLESDELLVGRFDFVHSLRVVVNLIETALKYSPPDTAVEVTARREQNRLQIAVSDRGPGVTAPETERIFEAFYHDANHAAGTGSVGLGLAIARELARAQGGEVTYAPRSRGGSVFTLQLPAADLTQVFTEP